MLELVKKKSKTTQYLFYDHYTLLGAVTIFFSWILEFLNNCNKDLLCSQEGICTMVMKNEQHTRNQGKMSQATPAYELDVRTERPWAHSSDRTALNTTLLLPYIIVSFIPAFQCGFPLRALAPGFVRPGPQNTSPPSTEGIMSYSPVKHSRPCEKKLGWSYSLFTSTYSLHLLWNSNSQVKSKPLTESVLTSPEQDVLP